MMDERVEALIDRLDLDPHPEGGYYRRTFESDRTVPDSSRRAGSAILYLLPAGEVSRFHRLGGDEIWNFHWGNALTLHVLNGDGYRRETLGPNLENGERPQIVVDAGDWFGATVDRNYTLVSCVVIPEFQYEDYELADREALLEDYPDHREIITRLTEE